MTLQCKRVIINDRKNDQNCKNKPKLSSEKTSWGNHGYPNGFHDNADLEQSVKWTDRPTNTSVLLLRGQKTVLTFKFQSCGSTILLSTVNKLSVTL